MSIRQTSLSKGNPLPVAPAAAPGESAAPLAYSVPPDRAKGVRAMVRLQCLINKRAKRDKDETDRRQINKATIPGASQRINTGPSATGST